MKCVQARRCQTITFQPFVDPCHTTPGVCGTTGWCRRQWLWCCCRMVRFLCFRGAILYLCDIFLFNRRRSYLYLFLFFPATPEPERRRPEPRSFSAGLGGLFCWARRLERKGGLTRGRRWKLRAAWLCSKQLQRWRAQVTRAHHGFEMVLVMGYNGFSAVASSSVRSFAIVFSFLERAPRPPARPAHYRQGDEWRVKEERGPFEEATKRFMERILADVLLRVADGGCKGGV